MATAARNLTAELDRSAQSAAAMAQAAQRGFGSAAEIARNTRLTGFSDALKQLQFNLSGVGADFNARGLFTNFQASLVEASTKSTAFARELKSSFNDLGVNIQQALLRPEQAFTDLIKRVGQIQPALARAQSAIGSVTAGRGTVAANFQQSAILATTQDTEQARRLRADFAALGIDAQQAAARAAPAWQRFRDVLSDVERSSLRLKGLNVALGTDAAGLGAAFGRSGQALNALDDQLIASAARRNAGFDDSRTRLQAFGRAATDAGRTLSIGLTAPLVALGAAAVKSAAEIDRNVNVLRAFIGSAEGAEARFRALVALAQKTPGLTTALASTLDVQLRVAGATEETINRILPAIGRLNAVAPLRDPARFTQNLVQLVTRDFQRPDLKELVGAAPLGGEIIKRTFKVASPLDAKAIREQARKLGIDTVDEFFAAFAQAATEVPGLQRVTESIPTRFEKMRDRITVALRPLGLRILDLIEPAVEKLAQGVERLSALFGALPQSVQQAIVIFGGLLAAIGPALLLFGQLAFAISSISALFGSGGALAGIGTAISAALGPIGIAIGVVIAAAAALYLAWQTNFGGIRELTAQIAAFVTERFDAIAEWWRENGPLVQEFIGRVWAEITTIFERASGIVKSVLLPAFDFAAEYIRNIWGVIGEYITLALQLLTGHFEAAGETIQRIQIRVWEAIKNITAQGVVSTLEIVRNLFDQLLKFVGLGELAGTNIGEAIGRSLLRTLDKFIPGVGLAVEALIGAAFRRTTQQTAQRQKEQRVSNAFAFRDFLRTKTDSPVASLPSQGIASEPKAKRSEAAQLARAQVELTKAQLTAETALIREQLRNREAALKASYDATIITTQSYYTRKLQIEQESLTLEIRENRQAVTAIEDEIRQAIARRAKEQEILRLETQATQLRSQGAVLREKQQALPEANAAARRQTEEQERRSIEQTRIAYLELTGVKQESFNRRLAEEYAEAVKTAAQAGRRDILDLIEKMQELRLAHFDLNEQVKRSELRFDATQTTLNIVEEQISGAQSRGQIDAIEAADAQIEARRRLRTVLLEEVVLQRQLLEQKQSLGGAEAETAERDLLQINERIAALRNLGAELTSQEKIQQQLADNQIFRQDRANRKLLEHLAAQKGLTEAVADAQIKAYETFIGVLERGIDKLTAKLGFFGEIVADLIKTITRNLITRVLTGVAGGGSGGGIFGGGGGLIGSIASLFLAPRQSGQQAGGGSVLQAILGGGAGGFQTPPFVAPQQLAQTLSAISGARAGGATGGFNPIAALAGLLRPGGQPGGNIATAAPVAATLAAALARNAKGAAIGGIGGIGGAAGTAQTLTEAFLSQSRLTELARTPPFVAQAGTTAGGAIAGGSFLQGLAPLAPLLGLSLGTQLGGQSTAGKILGGAGGLLLGASAFAGIAGTGAITGLLTGLGVGGTNAAILGSAAFGLLTNPITIIAGIGLLIGSFFLGRAKQRKTDEKNADAIWRAEADRLAELTRLVNADRIDGAQALAEAAQLRQQTVAALNQIKTKSVRESRLKNQLADVDRVYVAPLKEAAERQQKRRGVSDLLLPTFASGGFTGRVPGVFDGSDDKVIRVTGNELVLNPHQQANLADLILTTSRSRRAPIETTSVREALTRKERSRETTIDQINLRQNENLTQSSEVQRQSAHSLFNETRRSQEENKQIVNQTSSVITRFDQRSIVNDRAADAAQQPGATLQRATQPETISSRSNRVTQTALPRFASGGLTAPLERLIRVTGNELVVSPADQTRLAGLVFEASRARALSFNNSFSASSFNAPLTIPAPAAATDIAAAIPTPVNITLIVNNAFEIGQADQTKIVTNVINNTSEGRRSIVRVVRKDVRKQGQAGLAGDIESILT